MPRVLLTAFEPYDVWTRNSSWLALVELTKDLPTYPPMTTRLFPVDYKLLHERLERDVTDEFSHVIHIGQPPGSSSIALESIGHNVASQRGLAGIEFETLVPGGPLAYRSEFDVAELARTVRHAGIPCHASFHAGTYLCNAALYLTHHLIQQRNLQTKALFVHLPLDISQAAEAASPTPSLGAQTSAQALRILLDEVVRTDGIAAV